MNKIMGLDVGTKRIGVALSDFLQVIAQPYGVVLREPEEKAVEEIIKIARENNVEIIVIGLPKNMNGTIGSQANDCLNFGSLLKENFIVKYEDERLTSKMAEDVLKMQGKSFSKQKHLVDIKSSCFILQQFLDRKDFKND